MVENKFIPVQKVKVKGRTRIIYAKRNSRSKNPTLYIQYKYEMIPFTIYQKKQKAGKPSDAAIIPEETMRDDQVKLQTIFDIFTKHKIGKEDKEIIENNIQKLKEKSYIIQYKIKEERQYYYYIKCSLVSSLTDYFDEIITELIAEKKMIPQGIIYYIPSDDFITFIYKEHSIPTKFQIRQYVYEHLDKRIFKNIDKGEKGMTKSFLETPPVDVQILEILKSYYEKYEQLHLTEAQLRSRSRSRSRS